MKSRRHGAARLLQAAALTIPLIAADSLPARDGQAEEPGRRVPAQLMAARGEAGLERIGSLGELGIERLRTAGITSLATLSATDPERLAELLQVDRSVAAGIIVDANDELNRLQRAYSAARDRMGGVETGPPRGQRHAEAAAYATLIAPTTECAVLVRKVCGLENQCAEHGGCAAAKEILEYFNTSEDPSLAAESCVIALAEEMVFPWCTQ